MTMAELHCYSPTEVRFFHPYFPLFRYLLFILWLQVMMREVRGRIRNTFRRRDLMACLHLFADGPETVPQWMLASLFASIPPVSRTPPAQLTSEDITALRERTYALILSECLPLVYKMCAPLFLIQLRTNAAGRTRSDLRLSRNWGTAPTLPPARELRERALRILSQY